MRLTGATPVTGLPVRNCKIIYNNDITTHTPTLVTHYTPLTPVPGGLVPVEGGSPPYTDTCTHRDKILIKGHTKNNFILTSLLCTKVYSYCTNGKHG